MSRKHYKLFDHTADIGCEISGRTRKELFANAAGTLFDLLLEKKNGSGKNPATQNIIMEGEDLSDLLVNFLREILYLFNGRQWVVTGCNVMELMPKHVIAQLSGEPYDPQNHKIKMEIKAVTYHGLLVKRTKAGWTARVIFDV